MQPIQERLVSKRILQLQIRSQFLKQVVELLLLPLLFHKTETQLW